MSLRKGRPRPPEDVYFPVVPMLDMAFQLLAFFVLTFEPPTRETRLDLYLPATPAALPAGPATDSPIAGLARDDLEDNLIVRAEANDSGQLKSLRLGEAPLTGATALGDRLRQYRGLLAGRPLRVVIAADDALRYEEVAILIGTCAGRCRRHPPGRTGPASGAGAVIALCLAVMLGQVGDGPLSLADLADYPDALAPTPPGRAEAVGFRDLWGRPSEFRGKVVRVEGRVARAFRQPAVGRFPDLAEVWLVDPGGNPLCLVYPAPEALPTLGSTARFEGTFLRRLRYRSGDGDRLAPLIVGGRPPTPLPGPKSATVGGWSRLDWAVGGAAAGVVVLVLVMIQSRRPLRRSVRSAPPPFVDGDPPAAD